MSRRELACRQVVELLSDHLEGGLPAAVESRLTAHLAACDACDAYLDQLRRTIELCRDTGTEQLPAAVVEDLLGAYRSR